MGHAQLGNFFFFSLNNNYYTIDNLLISLYYSFMAGYLRKLISLENALKNAINDLKDEGLKEATGKSESHFRKCTDVNNKDNNIHHKDSIEIDKYCLKNGYGNPMLIAHESILEAERIKLNKFEDTSNTLINIGAKIGRLMETTQEAIGDESDLGKKLSQKEKQLIHKSIDEVEEKILQLKIIVDKN
tara:strand:+ start:1137 stop:1697 length:561 start_codon:yes stop_codon:yes gene_type:complete